MWWWGWVEVRDGLEDWELERLEAEDAEDGVDEGVEDGVEDGVDEGVDDGVEDGVEDGGVGVGSAEGIKVRISIHLDRVPAVLTGRALQSLEGHGGIVVAWRAVGLQAAGGSLLEVPAGADTRNIGAVEGKHVRTYCCTTN